MPLITRHTVGMRRLDMCPKAHESRFDRWMSLTLMMVVEQPEHAQEHVSSHTHRLRIKVKRAVCIAGAMV